MVPREDLNSIPRAVPCLLPRTRQSLFFPAVPARLVLTVREDAPSLSRVASGLGAASGLWLPAISAVSSHPALADSGPTTQPYSSGNILQGPACTAREQAVESGIPLRFGFFSASGYESKSTSAGLRRKGFWVSWAVTAPLGVPLFPSRHCGVGGCEWFWCQGVTCGY